MAMTGIVLQGGGALGAFELGALECLLDHDVKPDVVSGVSIGAINAAILCGCRDGDPRRALGELWDQLTTLSFSSQLPKLNESMSLYGNPGMYQPRTDYYNMTSWTSFYDTSLLLDTLTRNIDFAKLGPANFRQPAKDRAPRLILTATNLRTGRLDRFDSKSMQIEPSHVQASASLPPSFPSTSAPSPETHEAADYWDGGLFDNTPLSKVIDVLKKSRDPRRIMYVVTLFPSAAPLPDSTSAVIGRMAAIAFSNKSEKDLQRARETTKLIQLGKDLDRLMLRHKELRALRDTSGYKALKRLDEAIDFIEIANQDASGVCDFSAAGIATRRNAGYQAALSTLDERVSVP